MEGGIRSHKEAQKAHKWNYLRLLRLFVAIFKSSFPFFSRNLDGEPRDTGKTPGPLVEQSVQPKNGN